MSGILSEIVAYKRTEVEAARRECPVAELESRLDDAPPVRRFAAALQAVDGVALIAEVKQASPSAGLIREDLDPVSLARTYADNGAAAISCLTDRHFFQGELGHLRAIRREVDRPVLRKDFILDPYQVVEARVAGADAVLLIAECLDDDQLNSLYRAIVELGMDALVEIYEPRNLDRALALDPPLLGINNRNLETFTVDLQHTIDLADRVPDSTLLISESGIRSRDEVDRLAACGVKAVLVGETLMRAEDVGAKVRELSAVS